ncbi:hypothetical protein P170DRAFT_439105 [Aspergillus steynii IBT 23096]|uniref:AT DNA binding protein n=1 Tax=Aspergillus steynii IBT 23096 TaxID=1392250 RepID=A0A2I2G3L4_9EURO|nr:uncharacterized protein P170DRAFT_439105 [Aspergillus steynii IBT 23096]PLB47447.1 hypothetical protein P170DRAFT_439105 [Aspergillus steynii IBT 23096]
MDGPMSLQQYDGADPDGPLLPWDEVYQKLLLSPRNRPSIVDGPLNTTNLNSLLSASSYPVPESFYPPGQRVPDPYAQVPLYGGYNLDGPPRQAALARDIPRIKRIPSDPTPPPEPTEPPKKPKRQRTNATATEASARKRGRPRKNLEGQLGEDPEERRRMQIRLAQRAYRSRKEANISSLKGRIAQLESAVEKMSTTVISFSDKLVQSGVLASHADLTGHLRETVQTCLDLAKETSEEQDLSELSPDSGKSQSSPDKANGPSVPPELVSNPISPAISEVKDYVCSPHSSSDRSSPSENIVVSHMELSAFMERLHMACLYQAYLVLANPSVSMDRLKRPFRLLFTVIDRTRMVAFFQAALHAKVGQSRLDEWREVPFFYLGGAGSHYPRSPSRDTSLELHPLRYNRWETVQNPLSRVSPEFQDELDGEWFDIQDLEGFLREKNVHFFVSQPESKPSPLSINVGRFIPALITKALCLGRTPGFRRHDVEKALRAAIWA